MEEEFEDLMTKTIEEAEDMDCEPSELLEGLLIMRESLNQKISEVRRLLGEHDKEKDDDEEEEEDKDEE